MYKGTYTKICPICGRVNRNLFLEETDGWMECDKCLEVVKVTSFDLSKPEHPRLSSIVHTHNGAA